MRKIHIFSAFILMMILFLIIKIETKAANVIATWSEDENILTLYNDGLLRIEKATTDIDLGGYVYTPSYITKVIIGSGVTSIDDYAFSSCKNMTSITIPNSVTSIGDYAFQYCSSLTSITIPNSVTSIGYCAFDGCRKLSNITIPSSVTSIGKQAFDSCSSLTSITVPNSVTSIGDFAFQYCSSLTSITIPNSVTSIGGAAFSGCISLSSIMIPNSVTSIGVDARGNGAFSGCEALSKVSISDSLLKKINVKQVFEGTPWLRDYGLPKIGAVITDKYSKDKYIVLSSKNKTVKYYRTANKNATTITIPQSITFGDITYKVTEVDTKALKGNTKVKTIRVGKNVTKIDDEAFSGCTNLTYLTIGSNVTTIGNKAIYNCSSLRELSIPSNTYKFGKQFVGKCTKMRTLIFKSSKITKKTLADGACSGISNKVTVKVPKAKVSAYTKAFQSKGLSNKVKIKGKEIKYK